MLRVGFETSPFVIFKLNLISKTNKMKKPIQSSPKDFINRGKNYTSFKEALNEIATNSFFAPNVKNININFDMDNQSIWFVNDGEPMSSTSIIKAISMFGCESQNSAGNEYGTGLKACASYFTRDSDDSMLVVASKRNNRVIGVGWIDPNGCYGELEDMNTKQQKFVKGVLSSFKNGTTTMIFDTCFNSFEVENFTISLRHMFTTGLDRINITISEHKCGYVDTYQIYSVDRHYTHLDYIRKSDENVVFSFNKRKMKCRLLSTCTRDIKPEDYNELDQTRPIIQDFGIHMGYNNGYMPIHVSQVEIIGSKSKPQHYYMRGSLIAEPIEGDDEWGGVNEWKAFFSLIGNLNQQKVPNLSSPVNYLYGGKPIKHFESFYKSVVKKFNSDMWEWSPSNGNLTKDMFDESGIEHANKYLKKMKTTCCDTTYSFLFDYDVEDVVKFDSRKKEIKFKYDKDSPLIRKLLNTSSTRKHGKNDIERIIEPIIDIFVMDMKDEDTTDGVQSVIRKRIRKINNFYSQD